MDETEDNVRFDSVDDLKDWLRKRNVDEDDVDTAANKLMEQEFKESYSLLGMSSSQLERVGFSTAKAMSLSNRFKPTVSVLDNVFCGTWYLMRAQSHILLVVPGCADCGGFTERWDVHIGSSTASKG